MKMKVLSTYNSLETESLNCTSYSCLKKEKWSTPWWPMKKAETCSSS